MAASDFKDYYEILGVSRDAKEKDIKRAYRKLARQYHPDLNKDADAEARFKEINEANEVLSDSEKRQKYDQYGQYWQQAATGAGPTRSASRTSGQRSERGAGVGVDFDADFDQYADFNSFIEDLLGRTGTQRSYRTGGRTSGGAGGFQNAGFSGDPFSGYRETVPQDAIPQDIESAILLTFSEAFHGTQKRLSLDGETINVRIPAGAKPGSRIRVRGKGATSPFSQQRGDLYLNIELAPHPFFKFEGDNITCEVPITPWEATLGDRIEVPTPEGSVAMKIPAGVDSGKTLRLRGKGWKTQKGDRTDELVRLKIVTPKEISDSEQELLEKLKQNSTFYPREDFKEIQL